MVEHRIIIRNIVELQKRESTDDDWDSEQIYLDSNIRSGIYDSESTYGDINKDIIKVCTVLKKVLEEINLK